MSKKHAYAYEAGYRDGSINYELEHCPACKNVADLQEALAENAKLRELVASLTDRSIRIADKMDCLEAENRKLRELARDAWVDGHPDRPCEGCDIRDECHDDVERMRKDGVLRFSRCLFELRIEERMRELGVEVD